MPRVTIKDLQAQIVKSRIEKGRLKREMLHANAEHEKARRHLFDQVTHLREALRNESDNVQALRRLMNESGHRKSGVAGFCSNPPLYPDPFATPKPTAPPSIATHLL